MLEMPESATIARQLRESVAGHKIVSAAAGYTPHGFAFYSGDPSTYSALLKDKVIDDIEGFAFFVQFNCGELCLTLNDGANIRLLPAGMARPKKHQLLLELDSGAAIAVSIRMYGGIQLFWRGEKQNQYYEGARSKPSPLGDDFTFDYFQSLWDGVKPTLSAKAFLATEQRIPGLGNGCLHDILLKSGVHPKTKLSAIDDKREEMYHTVVDTLREMTAAGGRDTEKDIYGNPGGYKTLLSAKTLKYPCQICGGIIERKAYLGGNVYYCTACQPLQG